MNERKRFVVDTLIEIAGRYHDGHDTYDAKKAKYPSGSIPFNACTRQMCADMQRAIEYVKTLPPSAFRDSQRPCTYCGGTEDTPVEVETRDESTGYHNIEERCYLCGGKR